MIIISKKGRNYSGEKLTEHNLMGNVLVIYRGNIYVTRNRLGCSVSLCNADGGFFRNVEMKNVKLISCDSN